MECKNSNHVVTHVLGHWELIHPGHIVHHKMYEAPFMLERLQAQRSEPSHWRKEFLKHACSLNSILPLSFQLKSFNPVLG